MGVDDQPCALIALQRGLGIGQIDAATIDGLCGELQPTASPARTSVSGPVQIDGVRRRELFYRAGALYTLESVKGGVGHAIYSFWRIRRRGRGQLPLKTQEAISSGMPQMS